MGLLPSYHGAIIVTIRANFTQNLLEIYKSEEQQYLTIYNWLYAQKLSEGLDHLFTTNIKSEKAIIVTAWGYYRHYTGLISAQFGAIFVTISRKLSFSLK